MTDNKEHFEDVWDYAERTFKLNPIEKDKIINDLITELNNLRKFDSFEEGQKILGKIMFGLCSITEINQLNSWTALKDETENVIQNIMDKESD